MVESAGLKAALQPLVQPPPQLDDERVLATLRQAYGLEGRLRPLVSERDQNFRLSAPGGAEFVVKIANSAEPAEETDFLARALLYIERAGCDVPLPKIVLTRSGLVTTPIGAGRNRHLLRVVSWVPGRPAAVLPLTAGLAASMGQALAGIDRALDGFRHAAESRPLIWDLQRAGELRALLPDVRDRSLADRLTGVIDDFRNRVAPQLPGLRSQVIHADYHTENILVNERGTGVAGVIDFGDMVRAPLVVDVAVASSYQRAGGDDPLALVAAFVGAYHAVNPLDAAELGLLYDLVRARLATTIAVLSWRAATRDAGDAYLKASLASENGAPRFLAALEGVGRQAFTTRVVSACGGRRADAGQSSPDDRKKDTNQ